MEKMLYLAAQYLAAAGISFLEAQNDDSHTNMGYSVETSCLSSRSLNTRGDCLSLCLGDFSLQWPDGNDSLRLTLDGKNHASILGWIKDITRKAGLPASYSYSFHYDFPYEIDDDFIFKLTDVNRLHRLRELRSLAQLTLMHFLNQANLDSEVRIWPHHFDTGAYAQLPGKPDIAVGMGLAVPDNISGDHYFYISGYKDHEIIDCAKFKSLSRGKWKSNGFKGAILKASDSSEKAVLAFLNEALQSYREFIA